ncbi:MAG: hypothetical protein U0Y68_08660 [Blastocatellia bacterium]
MKDSSPGTEGETRAGRVQLTGITPNKPGGVFTDGSAKLIRKGSNIVFQMQLHHQWQRDRVKDRTKNYSLVFSKEPARKSLETGNAINTSFSIRRRTPRSEGVAYVQRRRLNHVVFATHARARQSLPLHGSLS